MKQIQINGLPVWLVIFPEGTRFNPVDHRNVIQKSQEIALEKGLQPLNHVLFPRSGATISAIRSLKEQFHAIYDITVLYGQTFDRTRKIRLAAPSMIGMHWRTLLHFGKDFLFFS